MPPKIMLTTEHVANSGFSVVRSRLSHRLGARPTSGRTFRKSCLPPPSPPFARHFPILPRPLEEYAPSLLRAFRSELIELAMANGWPPIGILARPPQIEEDIHPGSATVTRTIEP